MLQRDMQSIESILNSRSAFLKGTGGDKPAAEGRRDLTRAIDQTYPAFEVLRDRLPEAGRSPKPSMTPLQLNSASGAATDVLVESMSRHDFLMMDQGEMTLSGVDARRFITGGWLEELAWPAVVEAGAHEAQYSQLVGWNVEGHAGENEIDVIFRHEDKLGFVSCKALRSRLQSKARKHRARMMDAVPEADNMAANLVNRANAWAYR